MPIGFANLMFANAHMALRKTYLQIDAVCRDSRKAKSASEDLLSLSPVD